MLRGIECVQGHTEFLETARETTRLKPFLSHNW